MPVFIISRDRLDPLEKLVSWLELEGMTNIIVVDNASSYPPLVEYLDRTPHKVVRLDRNVGHTAPWSAGLVGKLASGVPYVVTDPDVVPEDAAHGAVEHMCWLLNRHADFVKVGLGLRIDDLPDHYEVKDRVLEHERQFWMRPVPGGAFHAVVDTTFALHRSGVGYCLGPALRTGPPFLAQHDPWYMDSSDPPVEFTYYRTHATTSTTWGASSDDTSSMYQAPMDNP